MEGQGKTPFELQGPPQQSSLTALPTRDPPLRRIFVLLTPLLAVRFVSPQDTEV